MIDRRELLLGGALLVAAAGEGAWRWSRPPRRRARLPVERWLPAEVDARAIDRDAAPLLPQRDTLVDQIYDDYAAARYAAPGRPPITLLIAHSADQGQGLELHRPEACYPPFGYRLGRPRALTLRLGARGVAARALTATRDGRAEEILYWTRIGDAFPLNYWETELAIARGALDGGVLDSVLARFSIPSADADAATATLTDFAAALLARAPAPLARLLIGTRPQTRRVRA